jgi:hypothetical protein
MTYELHYSGPLIAMRHKKDTQSRKDNGLLVNPPTLTVICYDHEQHEWRAEPVAWRVARTLAPENTAEIEESIYEARKNET